jgi:hypothetical protein
MLTKRSRRAANPLPNCSPRAPRFSQRDEGHCRGGLAGIERTTAASVEAIGARTEQLSSTIKASSTEAERSIGNLATSTSNLISGRIQQLSEAVKTNSAEAERSIGSLAAPPQRHHRPHPAAEQAVKTNSTEAERSLTARRHHHDAIAERATRSARSACRRA